MSFMRQGQADRFLAVLGGVFALALLGCAADPEPAVETATETIMGDCGSVHGADICTWGETMGGEVTAFGATIPMDAITGAPEEAPMAWPPEASAVVKLPDAVATATGFHSLTVFWEPHGHPPGAYLTPHFDFHFYSMADEARMAIDCVDTSKPSAIPAGYALPDVNIPEIGDLPGLCVPTMGMHSLPASELESPEVFEKTMVVGYYQGESIFIEPMITKATMMQRQGFTLDIPEIPGKPAGARYPMQFRADFDSTANAFRFVFSGFPAEAQ